jgi:plastocyanin domain-containing protein
MTATRCLLQSILPLCLLVACSGASLGGGEAAPEVRTVRMLVTERGFEPSHVELRKGEPVELVITRTADATCAREIVIDEYGIHTPLPLDTAVVVAFTPAESGRVRYGCAMGKMIGGVLVID